MQAAVFTAYALRLDALSAIHCCARLGTSQATALGIGLVAVGLFHFAAGLPWGIKLRLTPPPQLAPAVATPRSYPARLTPA